MRLGDRIRETWANIRAFWVGLSRRTKNFILFVLAVTLIVIAVLAEAVRGMTNYSRSGDVAGTVLMSFSSFGYYGQIWFNRAYTYECAIEEMPAGYGDTLMSVSPAWAFPVVVIVGMILSVWIANISMKKHKAVEKS